MTLNLRLLLRRKSRKMLCLSDIGRLQFFVIGRPATAGSKRVFKHWKTGKLIVTDACKHGKPWRKNVQKSAMAEMEGAGIVKDIPLSVTIRFLLPRPKSHFRSGRYSDKLRDDVPAYHLIRPDVDKMSRAILDAMTGVVYMDDSLIVSKKVSKEYASPGEDPGADITVELLT